MPLGGCASGASSPDQHARAPRKPRNWRRTTTAPAASGLARGEHAAGRRHEELAAAEQEPERRLVADAGGAFRRRVARDEALLRSVHGGQRSRRLAAPPWRKRWPQRRWQPRCPGTCDARFARVREVFEASFAEGEEIGASVAVVLDGEPVLSLLGGLRRPGADAAVEARHARERLLDDEGHDRALPAPARRGGQASTSTRRSRATGPSSPRPARARFRCAGCSRTASGLPAVRKLLPGEALYDWGAMTAALAAETPWWTPGRAPRLPRGDVRLARRRGGAARDRKERSARYFRERDRRARSARTSTSASPTAQHGRVAELGAMVDAPAPDDRRRRR